MITIAGDKILASGPPYIANVVPSRGGTEGGTRITIYGHNFAHNGIFSQYNVFIGNEACYVINYYSSDSQIVWLTPKCTTSFCQDPIWQGNHVVSLNIYVQTVESILSAFTIFTFDRGKTPELLSRSHYSWGSAISLITGKITAAYLVDVFIFIGGTGNFGGSNSATIGEAGDINAELWGNSYYRWYHSDYPIYYHRYGSGRVQLIPGGSVGAAALRALSPYSIPLPEVLITDINTCMMQPCLVRLTISFSSQTSVPCTQR